MRKFAIRIFDGSPAQALCVMIMIMIIIAQKSLHQVSEWIRDYVDGRGEQ
jgi:hypothetical protein